MAAASSTRRGGGPAWPVADGEGAARTGGPMGRAAPPMAAVSKMTAPPMWLPFGGPRRRSWSHTRDGSLVNLRSREQVEPRLHRRLAMTIAMSSISGRRPAACMSWRRCPASFGTHRSEWAAAVKPTPSAVAKPIPRERKEGEKQRKREGADMVSMTCGAHVGPTLSQPPRGIKSGSKPPRDLLPLLATPVAPALRIRASQSSVNNKAPAIVERKR
uniref:Uncharacterized protein n=1 Tax=Oryza meridionalis TaxID=40149 RepID=A0A0E0F7K0_9ORYZ